MNTIKRDGRSEEIDIDKIHRVLTWAADGLEDVSISEVELRSHIQFYEGIKTSDIQQILIKTAADMISDRAPDYQYFAARLDIFDLHKRVYGEWNRPLLGTVINDNCSRGVYDSEVFDTYTIQDILYLEDHIDDSRDLTFSYAAAKQLESKYLVQDRSTGEIFETPQILYMTMAMALFYSMTGQDRLDRVVDFYNATSTFKISLPTPIMAGVRTRTRQFSSCFPAGSSVYTLRGLKSIENVDITDKVLTQGGTYENVVAHTPLVSEADKFISVRNAFSIPWDYESTSDHMVIALKKKNKASRKNYSVEEWVEMQEIKVGDFLNIPFNKHIINTNTLDVPVPEGYAVCEDGMIRKLSTDTRCRSGQYDDKIKPFPSIIEITPHLMRIIGYFLAEGHANLKDNSFVFTFGEYESEYHRDIIDYFVPFGLNVSEHVTDKHAKSLTIYCKPFHDFLLREVGTGFNKMVISDTLMRVAPHLQKHLLSGVIRGDGCVHRNGMTLSMSNKTLIHQIGLICLRCGLYPSLGMREPDEKNSFAVETIYTLGFGRQIENINFLIDYVKKSLNKLDQTPKKKAYGLAKYMNGKYYAKVLAVRERENTGEVVYDLSIDNDHTFTVSGVCVHNCVLVDCGDSLNSINATSNSIVKYVSQRAGIGINGGRIRALGAKVRDGEISHTGCIPFYKLFAAALKSCSQGGVRGGAATLFYPFWHLEVESLLVLKNNKGVEENRIRHMDYAVQLNKLAYQRLIKGGNITLFSPEEVPELYDAFFEDQEKFQKLYEEAENNPAYRKKVVKAVDLFSLIVQERAGTGRVYIMNVDNVNEYGPFKPDVAPIHQSNLCMEVALPTTPLESEDDMNGEIALCTLAAFNLGEIDDLDDLEHLADLLVDALNRILDYQNYPIKAAMKSAIGRRPLGIGVINYAYYLAKNGVDYSSGAANNLTHRLFEAIQYYLLKASNNLAKKNGACVYFDQTEYSDGILPIDNYCKAVDDLHTEPLHYDWESLREDIKKYGLANSTLSALMPSETSSQISNATNGIEPPRGYVSIKTSKDGALKQVVPDVKSLRMWYELLWQMPSNKGYLDLVAIMQKFVDQSISANTNYDPSKFEDGKVPTTLVLMDMLNAYKLGIKTLYYHNTRDGAGNDSIEKEDDGCSSGACKI